jgi:delta(3,5)-delta(2,4)-dienoyl-CoA isomerase
VCLTARHLPPEEALRVGFVSAVLEDKKTAVATALEMARTIAEKSPVAIQGTKEILNHARDHSVAESKFRLVRRA